MFKNIILAVHGEENNIDQMMKQTLYLAAKNNCQLTLLNVKEDHLIHYGEVDTLLTAVAKRQFIDYINHMNDEQADKILAKFAAYAQKQGIKFMWKIRQGKPAEEISKEIKEGSYDLLVLGTKPPGPGNTSSRVKERVAKEHLCSVLMIK